MQLIWCPVCCSTPGPEAGSTDRTPFLPDDADAPALAPQLVDRLARTPRKPLPPLNETWVRRRARWAAYKRTQAAKPEGS